MGIMEKAVNIRGVFKFLIHFGTMGMPVLSLTNILQGIVSNPLRYDGNKSGLFGNIRATSFLIHFGTMGIRLATTAST